MDTSFDTTLAKAAALSPVIQRIMARRMVGARAAAQRMITPSPKASTVIKPPVQKAVSKKPAAMPTPQAPQLPQGIQPVQRVSSGTPVMPPAMKQQRFLNPQRRKGAEAALFGSNLKPGQQISPDVNISREQLRAAPMGDRRLMAMLSS